MIDKAMLFVRNELANYFQTELEDDVEIQLGNIALFDTQEGEEISSRIIITLVNIEEESTLKNSRPVQAVNGGVRYVQPPVHINLYLLFSCNFPGGAIKYQDSLKRLGNILLFFQQYKTFNVLGAFSSTNEDIIPEEALDFKLYLDLYTLTFEQINHLWGALGGKQLPSVLYKMRLVKVFDQRTGRAGSPIVEIEGQEKIS